MVTINLSMQFDDEAYRDGYPKDEVSLEKLLEIMKHDYLETILKEMSYNELFDSLEVSLDR